MDGLKYLVGVVSKRSDITPELRILHIVRSG